MMAFKGLTKDLVASMGAGQKVLEPGVTYREEKSKTASCGWHCTENPFECLDYFPLGENRHFRVEASGSIDEDGQNRISCTEITLVEELDRKKLAGYGMMYMVQHPLREKWEQSGAHIRVAADQAEAEQDGDIAIARGSHPRVRGPIGAILGLILEPEPGKVTAAKLFTASGEQAGKWWTVDAERNIREAESDEKKVD